MMKNISKEQADRIFRSLDTKGDNRVSLEEFRSGHLLNFISFEFLKKNDKGQMNDLLIREDIVLFRSFQQPLLLGHKPLKGFLS